VDSDFPGLRVTPGEIRLNYARQVVDDEHAKVWEVDLHSKYAEVLAYGHDDHGTPEVLIYAGEFTLGLDESLRGTPTRIALTSLDDGWSLMAESPRYTLRLVAYQPEGAMAEPDQPDPGGAR